MSDIFVARAIEKLADVIESSVNKFLVANRPPTPPAPPTPPVTYFSQEEIDNVKRILCERNPERYGLSSSPNVDVAGPPGTRAGVDEGAIGPEHSQSWGDSSTEGCTE